MMIVRSFLAHFHRLLLLASLMAANNTFGAVNAEQIAATANAFLDRHASQLSQQYGEQTRVIHRLSGLDSRVSMADCEKPLTTELKSLRAIGRINVQVRCDSPNVQWTLYVPAEVQLLRPVVTLVRPVGRGDPLNGSDLELREADVSLLTGTYFTDIEEVEGMEARRQLRADQPVTAEQLQPPIIVHKGDEVILTANSSGLTVKMPGIALRDGQQGQQISVRNSQSNRVVEAEVTGPGQVEVAM